MKWREDPTAIRPMLATLADPPLTSAGLIYEPKYDGIRALMDVVPGGRPGVSASGRGSGTRRRRSSRRSCARWTAFRATLKAPLLIDGEIVALDEQGRPAGFQRLQGRIHLTGAREVEDIDRAQPVALIAFDLLRDGDEDLRGLPLTERRARLEALPGCGNTPAGPNRGSRQGCPRQRASVPLTASCASASRRPATAAPFRPAPWKKDGRA